MPTTETIAYAAAQQLRAVREQWPVLLAAIETPPIPQWPPAQLATHLAQLAAADPAEEAQQLDTARVPLTLREHPAPANLAALDTAMAIETQLFDLADMLAAVCQRPVRRRRVPLRSWPPRTEMREDRTDATDPHRWHYRSPTDPGSRAYGLHWAAVWVEGRLLGDDDGDLFTALPGHMLHEACRVAGQCHRRLLRELQLDERVTPVEGRPCPWCGGTLRLHTGPEAAPTVWCDGGWDCGAPVPVSGGRRVWGPTDLPALVVALAAAEKRQARVHPGQTRHARGSAA